MNDPDLKTNWPSVLVTLQPLPDHITHILLNGPLHRTRSSGLGDAHPEEQFQGLLFDGELNSHLPVALDFIPNHDHCNLPLGVGSERLKDDLLIKTTD